MADDNISTPDVIAVIEPKDIARRAAIGAFTDKQELREALESTKGDLSADEAAALDAALAGTSELRAIGALAQTDITAIATMIQNLPVSLRGRIDMILAERTAQITASLNDSAPVISAEASASALAAVTAPAKGMEAPVVDTLAPLPVEQAAASAEAKATTNPDIAGSLPAKPSTFAEKNPPAAVRNQGNVVGLGAA